MFCNWLHKTILFTDCMSFCNIFSVPFAGAPIVGKSLPDDPVKGSACFLHRSLIVGSVAENDVNIVKLKFLKRVPHGLDHMLPGKTSSVGGSSKAFGPENLGADHVLVPGHIELPESLSHLPFTLSVSVELSSVEEVDTEFPSFLDTIDGELFCLLGVRVDPVPV